MPLQSGEKASRDIDIPLLGAISQLALRVLKIRAP
jgi:hypothetical protein